MAEEKGGGGLDEPFADQDIEDTQKDKFLTFRVGKENYGIGIKHVTEIIGIQDITEVPETRDFIKGVINLRGKVIPVVDVRTRFKLESRAYDSRTCIVVVTIEDKEVGLVVDTVNGVATIPKAQIEPPPNIQKGSKSAYVEGMGKLNNEVNILLNVNRLLLEEEMEHVEELVDEAA